MKKRLLSTIMVLVLLCNFMAFSSFAARDFADAEKKATALKSLDLFSGVSDTDFALERKPNRAEALVMFLRLMGAEQAALSSDYTHPFYDVPSWADKYVAYAYEMDYTAGVSDYAFGSNQTASSAMYLTFLLRALYYEEGEGADFTWKNPFVLASYLGILTNDIDVTNFLRADVALASWNTLPLPMKGGNKAIADIHVMSGFMYTQEQLDAALDFVKSPTAKPPSQKVPPAPESPYSNLENKTFLNMNNPLTGDRSDSANKVTFNADRTFSMQLNLLAAMGRCTGTYEVNGDYVDLHVQYRDFQGFAGDDMDVISFMIIDDNELSYISDMLGSLDLGASFFS